MEFKPLLELVAKTYLNVVVRVGDYVASRPSIDMTQRQTDPSEDMSAPAPAIPTGRINPWTSTHVYNIVSALLQPACGVPTVLTCCPIVLWLVLGRVGTTGTATSPLLDTSADKTIPRPVSATGRRTVHLAREQGAFGIQGIFDEAHRSARVMHVVPGLQGAGTRLVHVGDRIESINGASVLRMARDRILTLLRSSAHLTLELVHDRYDTTLPAFVPTEWSTGIDMCVWHG